MKHWIPVLAVLSANQMTNCNGSAKK